MYLSKELVLSAYKKLATLSDDPTQQGATQRVSAIRYFLAMDAFVKKTNKKGVDTSSSEDKKIYSSCVSDIVSITESLYTPNFYYPLKAHSGDCGTGSNFYSAGQVSLSASAKITCVYPKRSSWKELLWIKSGTVSVFEKGSEDGYGNLSSYFHSEEHKAALAVWLTRRSGAFSSVETFCSEVRSAILECYTEKMSDALLTSDNDLMAIVESVDAPFAEEPVELSDADIKDLFNVQDEEIGETLDEMIDFSDKPRQLISYGAPGTGKSFKVNETTEEMPAEDVVRTTFHPDSDYATFVGAYKPVMEVDDYETVVTTGEKTAGGTVTKKDGLVRQRRIVYEFVPQAFMQAYVRAWRNLGAAKASDGEDAAPVVLVIEEINRGNCAQIFGDLFQLLDRNDDGWSSYAINADVDLARWLKDEFAGAHKADGEDHGKIVVPSEVGAALPKGVALKDVVSGRKLLLPPNLYIWATMNTSDQSLFPIDSAFKRRWDWKYVPIAKPKDKDADWKERVIVANGQTFDWWRFLEIVNAQILEATKSEDKQLGYFFVKAPDATGEISASQFTGKVLFYLYNDVFRDETPPANLFGDGSDGNTQYRFKMFFDEQGEPKEDVVAAFLAQLFKNNPEKGKSAEASASDAAKGTDEA